MTTDYPTAKPGRRPDLGYWGKRAFLGSALTDQERHVLELASRGHTNAAIGRNMHLSEDTIKVHMRALMRRLGAADRAHAVRLGFERGILTPDAATAAAGQVTR